MEFLLSTGCFYKDPLEKSLYIADAVGFDGIELILNDIYYLADAAEKIKEFEKIAKITAFHAPFKVDTSKEKIVSLVRTIDLARRLGVSVVVFHPPMRVLIDFGYWKWFKQTKFKDVGDLYICLENMPYIRIAPFRFNLYSVYRFSHLKKVAQDKGLKLAFDTTHCGTSGWDLVSAFEEMGGIEVVKHVHLSDFKEEKGVFVEHLPPGEGSLDIYGFIRHLKKVGYSGAITLEISPRFLPESDRERVRVLGCILEKLRGV